MVGFFQYHISCEQRHPFVCFYCILTIFSTFIYHFLFYFLFIVYIIYYEQGASKCFCIFGELQMVVSSQHSSDEGERYHPLSITQIKFLLLSEATKWGSWAEHGGRKFFVQITHQNSNMQWKTPTVSKLCSA